MEFRVMNYFLTVAREESISRAAEALHVTQPNLSRQMQNLEQEIGKPLFVRGNRRTSLTAAGELLKKRAEEICELYARMQAELVVPDDRVAGEVCIAGGESHAVRRICRAATQVREANPDVTFHFYSEDTNAALARLKKGLIDFAIVIGDGDLTDCEAITLPEREVWGALVREDDPLAQKPFATADALAERELLCSRHAMTDSAITAWMGDRLARLRVAATYNLLYNASLLVRENAGVAIGLDGLVHTGEGSGLRFVPLSPAVTANVRLARKKDRQLSKAARLFLRAPEGGLSLPL